ncbi:hypothetical protein D3C78_1405860 [compost metagenome]
MSSFSIDWLLQALIAGRLSGIYKQDGRVVQILFYCQHIYYHILTNVVLEGRRDLYRISICDGIPGFFPACKSFIHHVHVIMSQPTEKPPQSGCVHSALIIVCDNATAIADPYLT